MTDLRRHLQAGDPLRHEPALTPDHVDRMRRVVIAATREPRPRVSATAIALLTGLTATAAAGVWFVGGASSAARTTAPAPLAANVSVPTDLHRRQVHFSTPGGTRLIWVFNPQFEDR